MFEVRGSTRPKRGMAHAAEMDATSVAACAMTGWTGWCALSAISFSQAPDQLTAERADFLIAVTKRSSKVLYVEVGPEVAEAPDRDRFRAAAARARFGMRAKRRHGATVHSSGRVFNDWVERARADVALLTTELATGPYPYAGIPWFSTAFGRDGVISALQMLWLNPGLARGVLAFLAQHQATETSPFSDSQPGKIMHETRKGEMAALRELPFGRYYGGVDTTPLYIHLACAYADRTGDMAFIDSLWPSLCAAAEWTEEASRATGFVTYQRAAESGLANQGWKDSFDSVFHADGRIPKGPIALVEVQGYVFAAFRGLAALARRRGEDDKADHWENRAEAMRDRGGTPFLAGRSRLLCPGDRRRRRALQGADVECRASALCRASRAGAGADGRRSAAFGVLPLRLGAEDARRRRRVLQPDVIPQRLDLAA